MRPLTFRTRLAILAGSTVLLIGVARATVDASHLRGRVARNVHVAGIDAGGRAPDALDAVFDAVEDRYRAMSIRVATGDGGFSVSGAELGLTVDRPRLRARLLAARRTGSPTARIGSYLASFVRGTSVHVPVRLSLDAVRASLRAAEGSARREPVDPQLKLSNGVFTVLPGSDGEGIDAAALATAVRMAIDRGDEPVTVAANRMLLPSKYTNEELQALVDRATQLTAQPVRIRAGATEVSIGPAALRRLVKPAIVDRHVELTFDRAATEGVLEGALASVNRPPVDAKLQIEDDGTIRTIPSRVGLRCCREDSVDRLQAALERPERSVVQIDLLVDQPRITTDEVKGWGITRAVSTFTTNHRAGEDRVKNIHRIADLLRGTIIPPGTTFSVNDTIGPRTAAKGFVSAHVIEDGVFKENYGGGISQFATTLFNAAFFAGLEIPEYKAHSLYIPRYPLGREATLSYPYPDLKVRNITPYGVMIWPTYTASSITITLFSTPYITSTVADRIDTHQGKCRLVETIRKRVFPDGREQKDTFRAVYQPKEGVDCSGNPTPGATTTTLRPPPTSKGATTTSGPSAADASATTRATASATSAPNTAAPPPSTAASGGGSGGGSGGSSGGGSGAGGNGVSPARPPVTGVG